MTGILSKYELDYLTGKVQLDGKATANARFRINKKLKDFFYLEMPLLESCGYLDDNGRTSTSLMKILESLKGFRFRSLYDNLVRI